MNINIPYMLPGNIPRKNAEDLKKLLQRHDFICHDNSVYEIFFLVCCYFCKYVSLEEMQYYYPAENSSTGSTWKVVVNRLITKKLILKVKLPHKDSHATMVYYLSKAGYQKVTASYIGADKLMKLPKKRGTSMIAHDYSVGMNFMEMCRIDDGPAKRTFHYHRETPVGDINRSYEGSLCIDAYISYDGNSIYIEQDLLNEHSKVLLNKIANYKKYGLLDNVERQVLVFSIREPFQQHDEPAFSRLSAEILSDTFEHEDSLYHVYEEAAGMRKIYLEQKLVNPKHHKRSTFTLMSGRSIDSNAIDTLRGILECMEILDGEGKRIGSRDCTGMQLREYTNSLICHQNPYMLITFNKNRYYQTKALLYRILKLLMENTSLPAYWTALSGASLLFITTGLLPKAFCYTALGDNAVNSLMYEGLLSSYYPSLQKNSFHAVSGWIKSRERPEHNFHLRNGFHFQSIREDGSFGNRTGTVYIENLSYDLGGYVRALHCCRHCHKDIPLHMVLLVNNVKEAQDFLSFAECYCGQGCPAENHLPFDRFFICFALQEKIWDLKAKLFTIDSNTGKPVYLAPCKGDE